MIWPFKKKTQSPEKLHLGQVRILRKLNDSNLPKDTLVKAQVMIKSGDHKTVALTQSIIQKSNGLPSLTKLLDKHVVAGVRNSELQKLNNTLKHRLELSRKVNRPYFL